MNYEYRLTRLFTLIVNVSAQLEDFKSKQLSVDSLQEAQ